MLQEALAPLLAAGKIKNLLVADEHVELIGKATLPEKTTPGKTTPGKTTPKGALYPIIAEPDKLPFAPSSLDLIASLFVLERIDDPLAYLKALWALLRPNGLLLGALIGGETLSTLGGLLAAADTETRTDRSAPARIEPKIALGDMAALMSHAGFDLPVADRTTLTTTHSSPLSLLEELRAAGLANTRSDRTRQFWRRDALALFCQRYQAHHGTDDGRVTARWDLVFFHGWKPDPGWEPAPGWEPDPGWEPSAPLPEFAPNL